MSRTKCILCGKTLPEEGQQLCIDCMSVRSGEETSENLRDIADVLSIMEGTNIKKSMEAIMRIADRMDKNRKTYS